MSVLRRVSTTLLLAALGALPASAAPPQEQAAASAPAQPAPSQAGPAAPQSNIGPFDPIHYIRIYEETRSQRNLLYESSMRDKKPTLLRVDENSKIVIELDEKKLTPNMALNGLFITAELSRVDTTAASTAKVEVLNYSEIAQDPRTQASQAGVALRTSTEVKTVMVNLYELTRDLVSTAYAGDCVSTLPTMCSMEPPMGERIAAVRGYLRAVQPRINAVADFFLDPRNTLVMTAIGEEVLQLDYRSVTQMANKLRSDVAAVVASGDATALSDLHLNVMRLWADMREIRDATLKPGTTVESYFNARWTDAVHPRLLNVLAPGTIDLRRYKATDGETLTVTIQARGAGGEGTGGISRDFQMAIRKLHPRVTTEPTAYYLRRNGDILNDNGEKVESNFAPAPGMTFGVVLYARNAVMRALAPGFGVNVSFMNFAANDFDPSITNAEGRVVGGFRSTTSSTIQVGTGLTASLFSNAVQFTYGWNLNVPKERSYWGIGFGFVQVGQEIAKFVKKAS